MTPSRRSVAGTDISVFPLCLGGNVFGWTVDEGTSFAVLDAYAEAGGNFIDTADMYSEWNGTPGISETIIGNWMASRGNRDEMVIATKVAKLSTLRGLSASTITAAAEASLQRLQTDRIDLYYAHEDDDNTPIEETMRAFASLVSAGKVRSLGASNFTASRFSESLKIAEQEGIPHYVAVQPLYNLMERDFEDDLQPVIAAEGASTFPYYGLARGFLTGKYRPDTASAVQSARSEGAKQYLNDRGLRTLGVLDDIAAAHSTSVASVALAWLAAQPTVTAPITSARSVEQLADLLPSVGMELSATELQLLSDASL